MIVAKQVADFITFTRASLLIVFTWLGAVYGPEGLPLAAIAMIYSWTSDSIDGSLARRSSRVYHTWIGDHDLEIDILVSIGLLIYMLFSGYVPLVVGGLYIVGWLLLYIYLGFHKSLGMTFQAPIYGWFLWVTIRNAPLYGLCMIVWILAAIIVTWPRFPKEVVPGFLHGLHSVDRKHR